MYAGRDQPEAVQALLNAKSDVTATSNAVSPFDVLWVIHHHYAVFHIGSHIMYCISGCIMAHADPDVMMVMLYTLRYYVIWMQYECPVCQ